MQLHKPSVAVALSCVLIAFSLVSCKPATHPNQLNAFDGATYDSLTAAHAALVSMGPNIAAKYPQYVSQFNTAAKAYSDTYTAYSLYRANPSLGTVSISSLLSSLTGEISTLENLLQQNMPVSPAQAARVIQHARAVRQASAPTNMNLADILTALEAAAQIAEHVPAASPYATLAAVVIEAAEAATKALANSSGSPIDLSLIQPVALITVAS